MFHMPVIGGKFVCLGYLMCKSMGIAKKRMKSLSTFGFFWHGCLCIPNLHKHIGKTEETLQNRYGETKARLQKFENAGDKVVSIWGCEFRKVLRENPGLKNEICSHPYVKTSPINIRDALYGGRTEATKTCYRDKEGEMIHYVDAIFPWATRKCTWVQTVPLTVWIGPDIHH